MIRKLSVVPNDRYFRPGAVPAEADVGTLIDEDVDVLIDGVPRVAYRILPEDVVAPMRKVSLEAKMSKSTRMNGLPTQSAVYGVMPRSAGRAMEYCRFTNVSHERPDHMAMICDFNEVLCDLYRTVFPDIYRAAAEYIGQNILSDWRWMSGPFQTCNINVNHAIPYHCDSGNSKTGHSNVLILKNRIAGGELVCPNLGITFSQRDRALIIFDGRTILHGVRPIRITDGDGPWYRSSIVYYTLDQCRHCLSRVEEVARATQRYDVNAHKSQAERIAEKTKHRDQLLASRKRR